MTSAFYLSLSFFHFYETRRKDFLQMFIHHLITLILLTASWSVNAIRGGSLIVFTHDVADVLLEGMKAAKYAKFERTCKFIFVIFLLVWIITRLGMFSKIVYCGITFVPTLYPRYPLYYVIAALNIFLLALHVIWTFMIIQVAVKMCKSSKIDDVRSSNDDDESDIEDKVDANGNEKFNGHKNM